MGPNYLLYLPPASQVRSATAIHKATSCPAPCQSCVRSRSAVGSGRCMLVGCPLDLLFAQARAAAADLSSLAPVNTPECNQLNLPIKCSAGHASHAQPWRSPGAALAHTGTLPAHWHTPARSRHAPRHTGTHRHAPGTQIRRLLSCHSFIPPSPSPRMLLGRLLQEQ